MNTEICCGTYSLVLRFFKGGVWITEPAASVELEAPVVEVLVIGRLLPTVSTTMLMGTVGPSPMVIASMGVAIGAGKLMASSAMGVKYVWLKTPTLWIELTHNTCQGRQVNGE